MGNLIETSFDKNELEKMINAIEARVNEYVKFLKKQSSDEILNGSLIEAQKIISQILPIENEYKQLAKSILHF